jgi:predicted O-methyltransferase YrrM
MQYKNPDDVQSSYGANDLGRTFYDIVLKHKPKKIVEWGTLYGYSTIAMAMALDELGEGHIVAYDLFEKYPYHHSTLAGTQANIDRYEVSSYVTLKQGDFKEWIINPEPFDLLHVDLSNHGETIKDLYKGVKDSVAAGAIVIFEGGAKGEREQIPWMVKYGFPKIRESGVPYTVIDARFPSLSMIDILKK